MLNTLFATHVRIMSFGITHIITVHEYTVHTEV